MTKMLCVEAGGYGFDSEDNEVLMTTFIRRGKVYEGRIVEGGYYFECIGEDGTLGAFDVERFELVEE